MKAKEFDDLIRQQFDQNDFEYKPQNWDRLRERLDNKPGKRRTLLWVPLAIVATASSIAASIAMIIALPAFLQHRGNNNSPIARAVENTPMQINTINTIQQPIKTETHSVHIHNNRSIACNIPAPAEKFEIRNEDNFSLRLPDPVLPNPHKNLGTPVFNTFSSAAQPQKMQVAKIGGRNNSARTFNLNFNDQDAKVNKTSLGIASGVNYGASLSGFSIGATGKRMLGNKLYLEGDIAFVSNTATERSTFMPSGSKSGGITARKTLQARTSNGGDEVSSVNGKITEVNYAYNNVSPEMRENNYNLYYAQITPSIGYNIHRQFSIGIGGDMQRLLIDGRPGTATADANGMASKEIAAFDMGIVGKTECALTKKIKAGLCYRQGINNIVNGNSRYMDRTYLQVQMKYMIFKK